VKEPPTVNVTNVNWRRWKITKSRSATPPQRIVREDNVAMAARRTLYRVPRASAARFHSAKAA
jgi:hypothetical protein